jgi:hypothetical protein
VPGMCSPWTGRDRRPRCRPGGRAGNSVRRGGALSGPRRHARPDRRRPGPGTATARGAGAARIAGRPLRSCGPDLGPSGVLPGRARCRARCALPRDVRAAGDPRRAGEGRPAADRGPRRGGGRAGGAGGKQPRARERGVPGGQAVRGGGPHAACARPGPVGGADRPSGPAGGRRHGLQVVPGKLVWELRRPCPATRATRSGGSLPTRGPARCSSPETTWETFPPSSPRPGSARPCAWRCYQPRRRHRCSTRLTSSWRARRACSISCAGGLSGARTRR